MLWSVFRTDRTGPTLSGAWELKIAARRVIPASTTSSYTTSARSIPYCFAASVLLILTVTAGRRRATLLGSGKPVSGAVGTATRRCAWAAGRVVVVRATALGELPLQPAATTTHAKNAATTERALQRG